LIRTLHGKVSIILLVLFLATAAFNVMWTLFSVRLQLVEADQRLNHGLADYLVKHEFSEGELSSAGEKLEHSFEMLMDINPNIELYLLDRDGSVLAYSAPPGRVVRERVSVEPIRTYLSEDARLPILGEDPRSPWKKKPFSAAAVSMGGLTEGYLYIILGGEERDSLFDLFTGNAIFRLSLWVSLSGLVFLFATAFLLFRHISVRHRRLTQAVEAFRDSGFTLPVRLPDTGRIGKGDEIDLLGTAFSEMSEKIINQILEIDEKDRLRRELVSNITHDLRTPLASLQGYLETLAAKQERLSEEEKNEILEKAFRLISRLGKLIAELLEMARLDALDVKALKEPFPLNDLVNDVLMDQQAKAEMAGVRLITDIAGDTGLVTGDIRLLERAIQNIVDNAVKFTPKGGHVRVVLTREEDRIRLSVSDTGPGIDEKDLPLIFERFYRTGTSGDTAGVGLGLAIAQRIANLHGTAIEVESNPGQGTTFSFSLEAHR
jgi:signal transduction histidine kinase